MDPMTTVPDPAERPDLPPAPTAPAAWHTSSSPSPVSPASPEAPPSPATSARAEPSGAQEGSPPPGPAPRLSDGSGLLGAEGLRPVSAQLIPARYIAGSPGYVIGVAMAIGAIVCAIVFDLWWLGPIALLPLTLVIQGLVLTPRRVRALGYLDGPEELTIASGILFRDVSTIPYGRIQSVKIDEGPVDRRFGLAQLTISTAAAGSTVTLPGLPQDEAERLRQLLTERGIEKMAAL